VPLSSLNTFPSFGYPSRARSLPPEYGTGTGWYDLAATYSVRSGGYGYGYYFPWYQTQTTVDVIQGQLPQDVRQAQSEVDDQWTMPFFMSDARSAFYVTTTATVIRFPDFGGYGVFPNLVGTVPDIPPLVVNPPWKDPLGPVEITPQLGDPAQAQGALAEAGGMRAVLGTAQTFTLGNTVIGATGSVVAQEGLR
jgi:hypothetical protein